MKHVSEPSISSRRDPVLSRLVYGIRKLADVLKNEAWLSGQSEGLTPTQGQILVLLRRSKRKGLRLTEIAGEMRITSATASDAVTALADKGLVEKKISPADRRAIAVCATAEGRQAGWKAMQWSNFMAEALQVLSNNEREVMMRGVSKALQALHLNGRIPAARMCLSCSFFEPGNSDDRDGRDERGAEHHCNFGDFAFGDADLRLDCSAYSAAQGEEARKIWAAFSGKEITE